MEIAQTLFARIIGQQHTINILKVRAHIGIEGNGIVDNHAAIGNAQDTNSSFDLILKQHNYTGLGPNWLKYVHLTDQSM